MDYATCKRIVTRRAAEGNKHIADAMAKATRDRVKIPRQQVEQWAMETEAAHECLRFLSGKCNYAQTWDGKGFCKRTAAAGKALAGMDHIPEPRFWEAIRMVYKFRGQLAENPVTKQHLQGPLKSLMESVESRRKK